MRDRGNRRRHPPPGVGMLRLLREDAARAIASLTADRLARRGTAPRGAGGPTVVVPSPQLLGLSSQKWGMLLPIDSNCRWPSGSWSDGSCHESRRRRRASVRRRGSAGPTTVSLTRAQFVTACTPSLSPARRGSRQRQAAVDQRQPHVAGVAVSEPQQSDFASGAQQVTCSFDAQHASGVARRARTIAAAARS